MKTKIIKRASIILIATIAIISGNTVWAQQHDKQGPPPIPNQKQIEKMVGELSEKISLNDEQEEQVSELFVAHFDEVKEKIEVDKNNRDAHRNEMEALRKDFEKDVNLVLNKEQQKLFEEYSKKPGRDKANQKHNKDKK
jgi:hypothetical protein